MRRESKVDPLVVSACKDQIEKGKKSKISKNQKTNIVETGRETFQGKAIKSFKYC